MHSSDHVGFDGTAARDDIHELILMNFVFAFVTGDCCGHSLSPQLCAQQLPARLNTREELSSLLSQTILLKSSFRALLSSLSICSLCCTFSCLIFKVRSPKHNNMG